MSVQLFPMFEPQIEYHYFDRECYVLRAACRALSAFRGARKQRLFDADGCSWGPMGAVRRLG